MGVARAPVVGSGCCPAWRLSVSKPGLRGGVNGNSDQSLQLGLGNSREIGYSVSASDAA